MVALSDAQMILDALAAIRRTDTNVIALTQRLTGVEQNMATINEALTGLSNALTGLESDVQRVLAALADENLSPEAQQAVDALSARMSTLDAQMDAAVPEQPPTPL